MELAQENFKMDANQITENNSMDLNEKIVDETKELTQENSKLDDEQNSENNAIESKEKHVDKETTEDNKKESKEEFKYLSRNEFTSEIYKIELRGLGYFGIGELKSFLKTKLQLDVCKVKSPNGNKEIAFICFRSAKDYSRSLEILNGYKWKGRVLFASSANASPDPLVLKRRKREGADTNSIPDKKNKIENVIQGVCPLAHMPYEEQIIEKNTQMQKLLKKFCKDLLNINSELKQQVQAFEFKGVLRADKIDGYRNKNEFSIGKNATGDIVVGFRVGSYIDGSTEVSEVTQNSNELPHIPNAAKWAASSFQEFARNNEFLHFNPETNEGHYKQLMVRTSEHTGEIMLVVGIYTTNLTDEQNQELKERLKAYYMNIEENASPAFRCTSLYYQDCRKRVSGEKISDVEHLAGSEHITDEILGLKFRISPLAFFQVNTPGANVLYEQAIKLAAPNANSVIFDICCGTGTIGLAFAKHARRVLGVDIIPEAIEDAKLNAQANNISNVCFYAGNADDFINSMVRESVYDCATNEQLEIIAIVDPPRNGLHSRSITAIRAASQIKRLVYVSCFASRAQINWIDLCRPQSKKYKGEPFYPKTAVAVDMFPHTSHTELVILFER